MSCYTREQIQATMESKGYKYFTGGDFDVNIIGVRNSETNGSFTGRSLMVEFLTKLTN